MGTRSTIAIQNEDGTVSEKNFIRDLTYSGDFYRATPELWKAYWDAVNRDDWDFVEELETCQNPDFDYDP